MQLKGQTAIVTGSTKGIGRAIAEIFHREGANVVIHGTDASRADEVVSNLKDRAVVCLGDVGDPETGNRLVKTAQTEFGGLDILVNNAGVVKMEPFLEFSLDTWRKLLDVHLTGTMLCGQAAGRVMAAQGHGRIVNISTVAASMGQFGFAAYAAVKGGIESLTRVMAIELAQSGVSVNCIAPGPVWNDMMEHLYGIEKLKERSKTIPLQRMGNAEEVAALALYLASQPGGYMTGQVLTLDGGASAAGCYTLEVFKRSKL